MTSSRRLPFPPISSSKNSPVCITLSLGHIPPPAIVSLRKEKNRKKNEDRIWFLLVCGEERSVCAQYPETCTVCVSICIETCIFVYAFSNLPSTTFVSLDPQIPKEQHSIEAKNLVSNNAVCLGFKFPTKRKQCLFPSRGTLCPPPSSKHAKTSSR